MPLETISSDGDRNRLYEKARRLREEVSKSELKFDGKEALYDMIDSVTRAPRRVLEGACDSQQRAIGESLMEITLMLVEDRVHKESEKDDIIEEALRRHDQECPVISAGVPRKFAFLLKFAWPLAVVATALILSGNAPAIIKAVAAYCSR